MSGQSEWPTQLSSAGRTMAGLRTCEEAGVARGQGAGA